MVLLCSLFLALTITDRDEKHDQFVSGLVGNFRAILGSLLVFIKLQRL